MDCLWTEGASDSGAPDTPQTWELLTSSHGRELGLIHPTLLLFYKRIPATTQSSGIRLWAQRKCQLNELFMLRASAMVSSYANVRIQTNINQRYFITHAKPIICLNCLNGDFGQHWICLHMFNKGTTPTVHPQNHLCTRINRGFGVHLLQNPS